MTIVPSKYQQAIYEAFEHTSDSLLVEAVAGSGKTTVLIELAKIASRAFPHLRIVFLAFNKSICDELNRRLRELRITNVVAVTLHSAGWSAWRRAGGLEWEPRVKNDKVSVIMRELLTYEENKRFGETTRKLVGYAKGIGLVPGYRADDPANSDYFGLVDDTDSIWEGLIDHYGLDEAECNIPLVRKVLARSIELGRETCDFDDMLAMPVIAGVPFDQYDVVLIDESQDVSSIQMEMISRMTKPGGRVIAVGDRHQCQPAGTMVRIPGGGCVNRVVPIESLKDGDSVVSVDFTHSCFKAGGQRVKVASRGFLGVLTEIASVGRHSRYTPNHKCVVNCKPLEKMYAVYLMEKNGNFRIGSTQFGVRAGSGIRTRMLSENATRLWVLSLHSSKADACFEEAILGNAYNIPEKTFVSQTADNSGKGLNQPLLDRFWAAVHNEAQGLKLLAKFNREFDYPLVSRGTAQRFRTRRPSEVEACNLMAGMLVLHDEEAIHYKKHQWKPIDMVMRYRYDGPVYSLDVEGNHTYIADGIATHNSIYGFRGAGTDSMDIFQRRFRMRPLPLSVSYRCPAAVVEHARQWVPQIEAREDAPAGFVGLEGTDWAIQCEIALGAPFVQSPGNPIGYNPICSNCGAPAEFDDATEELKCTGCGGCKDEGITKWRGIQDFLPGDAILCRLTRPVVAAAFALIRQRIACHVLGRDIGKGLVDLVRKAKSLQAGTVAAFGRWLDDYEYREAARLRDKGKHAQAGLLADKADTIRVFMEQLAPDDLVPRLIAEIERLFVDNGNGQAQMVTLATVHKSKGLQWPRVFILDAGELMPCRWARQQWELAQELNIQYVAATRAMHELRYIKSSDLGVG